jgi:hypothetical protein
MAKPFGPLLELADRWRPIFADPDRDYFCLTELRSARRARNGARLDVAADDGPPKAFEVRFLAPARLRDIKATGAASGVEMKVEDGITVVRLQAGGPFSLTASVLVTA